jgi:hypothetical protein
MIGCVVALALGAVPGAAAPLEEFWETAHVEGVRIGFAHTAVEAVEDRDGKRLKAAVELDLTLRRQNAALRLRMEQGTEETAEGKVVAVSMRQFHDKGQQLSLAGKLDGERMHVVIDAGRIERRLPWSGDVVGLYGRERLWAQRKPKAGDRFSFPVYDPTVNAVVTLRVAVREPEEVALPSGKAKLLRVELTPDKLEGSGVTVQLPATVLWLDEAWTPVRRQFEMEGLGVVVLTRASREAATAPVTATPGKTIDVGLKALVALDRPIEKVHATRSAVYRLTLRGDAEAATAFKSDAHQETRNARGDSFELVVHPPRPGEGKAEEGPPAKEYLESCYYIDSDDARVQALARRAAGDEADPWKKAVRIERFVKQAMRVDNAAPMVPASQVARDPHGDCRAYALLTAALCRAEGLPARTAIGLVYVEKGRKPYLGFHMWTEVRIDGRWLGLDATLGQGGVGAGHVKISDHSWGEARSLTPLLPVSRVLGKLSAEVVRAE